MMQNYNKNCPSAHLLKQQHKSQFQDVHIVNSNTFGKNKQQIISSALVSFEDCISSLTLNNTVTKLPLDNFFFFLDHFH